MMMTRVIMWKKLLFWNNRRKMCLAPLSQLTQQSTSSATIVASSNWSERLLASLHNHPTNPPWIPSIPTTTSHSHTVSQICNLICCLAPWSPTTVMKRVPNPTLNIGTISKSWFSNTMMGCVGEYLLPDGQIMGWHKSFVRELQKKAWL